jgi:hypothetical protein
MSIKSRRRGAHLATLVAGLLVICISFLPVSSSATSPGRNGRIAVSGQGNMLQHAA